MPSTTSKYKLPYPLLEDANNPPADFRALAEKLDQILQDLQDQAHPVGSYYWSSQPTDPASLFGGTWEQIEDKFVFAASGQHPAGETGGEEKHTLTVDEIPSHNHSHNTSEGGNLEVLEDGGSVAGFYAQWGYGKQDSGIYTAKTGGNQPHNNMPPYIVAYCWRRTA